MDVERSRSKIKISIKDIEKFKLEFVSERQAFMRLVINCGNKQKTLTSAKMKQRLKNNKRMQTSMTIGKPLKLKYASSEK